MNEPKAKVCFVAGEFYPKTGGLAKAAYRVVDFLVQEGYEVHVVTPYQEACVRDYDPAVNVEGFSIYRIPVDGGSSITVVQSLNKILQELDAEHRFDIFHAFWFEMAYACIHLVADKQRPLIASIRGSDAYMWATPQMERLCRLVLKNVTHLTSVNSYLLQMIVEKGYSGTSSVIKNSIIDNGEKRWELCDDIRGRIGTVATFRPVKDCGTLIGAYNRIPSANRSRLMMIGYFEDQHRPEQERIEELIRGYELENEVVLTGKQTQEDVYEHLRNLHVFVMTSKTEGFPNALLEAASLGVPIVVTAFNGHEDYVTHGENALVVPVGDEEKIAEAINMILEDDELARRLSAGAYQLAKNFTPGKEKQEWLCLYEHSLNKVLATNKQNCYEKI